MDARDNENPKLHIHTLHILSEPAVCACIWDSGVLWLSATNDITSHHFRHLRSVDLRLLPRPHPRSNGLQQEMLGGAAACNVSHGMQATQTEMQSARRYPKCFTLFKSGGEASFFYWKNLERTSQIKRFLSLSEKV